MKILSYEPNLVMKYKPEFPEKEPFYNIKQDLILQETQNFNFFKFQQQESISIFTKIIYLINQGMITEKRDQELLFFRTSKLFEFQNPRVTRFVCLILRMLMLKENNYFLLSCISKDITRNNTYLKLSAIKLIPLIIDQCIASHIDSLLQIAFTNKNSAIFTTAAIAGFKIYQNFPEIMKKWFSPILNQFLQEEQPQSYQGLILLFKISRGDEFHQICFINLILDLIKKDASPLFRIQLIKIIKYLIIYERKECAQYQKLFLKHLSLELESKDEMVALEAAKALISITQITPQDIQFITRFLQKLIETGTSTITKNYVLRLYFKISQNSQQVKQLSEQTRSLLENLVYNQSLSVSQTAIKLCINLNKWKCITDYLIGLYQKADLQQKVFFLKGLQEYWMEHFFILKQLDGFVATQFKQIQEYELVKAAIYFLSTYIYTPTIQQEIFIKILLDFGYYEKSDIKYMVIILLRDIQGLSFSPMDEDEIDIEIKRLQNHYNEYFAKKDKITKNNLEYSSNNTTNEDYDITDIEQAEDLTQSLLMN